MSIFKHVNILLLIGLIICINSQAQTCAECNNAGFEDGSGGGWQYWVGSDDIRSCGQPPPNPCITNSGFISPQHVLQTAGNYDPMVGGTILPVVPPFGGNSALRLGDGNDVMGDGKGVGSMAARATFTYFVTPATSNFTYRYAIIIEEPAVGFPNHSDAERPYFNVSVKDKNGNKISCGDLFVVARPPMTDFTQTNNRARNVWYRGWSTVVLPLAAYIGQCVSIEFTTGDCALGAHFGYAYIDASCGPAEGITVSKNACGGHQLAAPVNASSYTWTNKAGGTTGIEGPNDRQTVDVNKAGTYQVSMGSLAGPNCSTILEITVTDPGPSPAKFTPFTGCAGTYTQFTDVSVTTNPVTGWAWDFDNDNLADAVIKNPQYSFPRNGTYPVTLTIFSGNCSASVTDSVYVDLPIYPTIDPAGPFCVSAAPDTLKTSITGGTWSGPGITDATLGVFTPSAANIGSNQIIYATAESCPGKDTITIVVNSPLSDAGRDITICSGSTGNLGSTSTSGYSYSWEPTTGLNSAAISSPIITLTNTTNVSQSYTYTVTTNNVSANCPATDVVQVTVNPPAFVNAGPDQTICEGNAVKLNGSGSGAATSFTWSGTSGTYNPNPTTPDAQYYPSSFEIATGSVNITLTSNDPSGPCPTATDELIVTINPKSIINAGPDQTICAGTSAALAASIGGSATGGIWSGGAGSFNPDIYSPNATYTPNITEQNNGSVLLTYTGSSSGICPTVYDQVLITIQPVPTVNAGVDQTICNGSATLAGSIGGSATSMIWSGGSGSFNPSNTSGNAQYTPSDAEIAQGTVNLTLTGIAPGVCPPVSDQMTLRVNPMPQVNAGADQTICVSSALVVNSVILSASYNNVVTGGTWSGGLGSGSFSPNNTDPNATYTLSEIETGTSEISLAYTTNDPDGPCPAVRDEMKIIINRIPTVNAGPDQTICSGSTVSLSGTFAGSATSVTWSGGAGTYSPDNTSLNCVYTPTADEISLGNVILTLTTNDPAGPCPSVTDQIRIIINPPAQVSAGPDQTICSGSNAMLAGVYNGASISATWSGGDGSFGPNNTVSNAYYTPGASDILLGSVTLTYTSNDPVGPCPAVSDDVVLTINPTAVVNTGTTQPVCYGSNVQLNGSISGSATSASWSGGLGRFNPNNTTLNATYIPTPAEYTAGNTLLTLTSNDPTGPCPAVSSNILVNFYPLPIVNFVVDDPDGCPIHCVQFTDFSSVGGGSTITNWNWTFGDGGTSTTQNPAYCYEETGKYDVSLAVVDDHSCKANLKIDKMITVFAEPVAEFSTTPNPASVLERNVTFIDQSSNDVNFWLWDFGDGDSIAPKVQNPIHMYPETPGETYKATLTVRNRDFCYANVTHDVIISPEFSFFIPNAFTPKASAGINDTFNGKGIGIIQYDMWIFDRWGDMVFHTNSLDVGWDGRANGGKRVAQEDVYVYKVELKDVFKESHSYVGTFTLVR